MFSRKAAARDRRRDCCTLKKNKGFRKNDGSPPDRRTGQSAAPHEHKLAVGIDLGTTNSLVATVRSGIAVALNDALGRSLLPSVVRYAADGSTEVGYEPLTRQAQDPKNTIASVRRFMGRGRHDIAHVESISPTTSSMRRAWFVCVPLPG